MNTEHLKQATFKAVDDLQNERDRLAAQAAQLRAALQRIWDEDECGFILGPDDFQCVKCGRNAKDSGLIVHEDHCTQGFIQSALEEITAPALVPAGDVEPLVAEVARLMRSSFSLAEDMEHPFDNKHFIQQLKIVGGALAAYRATHPKP